tara:strand:+ start:2689 stop:3120 length:432 start_codon:yes stop_codon:yes gene_type:complete
MRNVQARARSAAERRAKERADAVARRARVAERFRQERQAERPRPIPDETDFRPRPEPRRGAADLEREAQQYAELEAALQDQDIRRQQGAMMGAQEAAPVVEEPGEFEEDFEEFGDEEIPDVQAQEEGGMLEQQERRRRREAAS